MSDAEIRKRLDRYIHIVVGMGVLLIVLLAAVGYSLNKTTEVRNRAAVLEAKNMTLSQTLAHTIAASQDSCELANTRRVAISETQVFVLRWMKSTSVVVAANATSSQLRSYFQKTLAEIKVRLASSKSLRVPTSCKKQYPIPK